MIQNVHRNSIRVYTAYFMTFVNIIYARLQ